MALADSLVISFITVTVSWTAPLSGCVKVTIVSGKGEMDGKYILKEVVGEKPDEVCNDGCIYYKDENKDDEYCFKSVEDEEGAFVQCEVTIRQDNFFGSTLWIYLLIF